MQRLVSSFVVALGVVACGGAASPPPITVSEPVVPEPEPVVEPTAEAAKEPEPVAEPLPEEEPPAPVEKRIELIRTTSAGRPMVQYVEGNGITTTLGHNGGILKIGEATLRIPDGALREGMNVTFALAPKVKGPEKAKGAIYKLAPKVHSAGPRFQIVLPVPQGAGPLGFAVELSSVDEKTRKAKTEWQVVAPTKVFADSDPKLALLEVDALFEGHVTLVEENPPNPEQP